MTRVLTAQLEKEFHWMRLIDLEGDTSFTLKNQSAVKGQKLGLCPEVSVVPHFPLSPPCLVFLTWGDFHVPSRFARSTIPERKWGLLLV